MDNGASRKGGEHEFATFRSVYPDSIAEDIIVSTPPSPSPENKGMVSNDGLGVEFQDLIIKRWVAIAANLVGRRGGQGLRTFPDDSNVTDNYRAVAGED